MNVALWIVAALLAAAFLFAGLMKALRPKADLAASGMAWVDDFAAPMVKFIGTVEVLAAVGLILPAIVDVAPILVPLAATGLAVLMVGAAITHLRRREPQMAVANVVLLALAVFVAWGRFGPHSF